MFDHCGLHQHPLFDVFRFTKIIRMNTKYSWTIILFTFILTNGMGQRIYQVNAADDSDDGMCNATHCSLREAINEANRDLLPSEIRFAVGVG